MARIIITTQVEDLAKWEAGFRSHGDMFRTQGVTRVDYGIGEDNTVAACFELRDLDFFMKTLESPETAEAMAFDGVKRETVKLFVVDKEFVP